MKKIKEESGITLLALIVTIVILLILISITIGVLNKSNLISKSQSAKKIHIESEADEAISIATADLKVEIETQSIQNSNYNAITEYNNGNLYNVLANDLKKEKGWNVNTKAIGSDVIVKFQSKEYLKLNDGKSRNYQISLKGNNAIFTYLDSEKNTYIKNSYATWVWAKYIEDNVKDSASVKTFLDNVEEQNVNVIYLCFDPSNFGITKEILKQAGDRNISIYWCNGDPGFILGTEAIYNYMDEVNAYNVTVDEKYRVKGMHYDIEPYALSDYEDNKEKYDKMYVDFARLAYTYSRKLGLEVEYDIHCHYNNRKDHNFTDDDGTTKNVGEEMAKYSDQLVLMDYFQDIAPIYNAIANEDDGSKNWMDIIAENNKNLIIGFDIETLQEGYDEKFSREDYDEIMNDLGTLIAKYENEHNIDTKFSFAAHHFPILCGLKSSVVELSDITMENKNIGKRTTYRTNTGNDDIDNIKWNVLYRDSDYIYLIANDFVNVETAMPIGANNAKVSKGINSYTGYISKTLADNYSGSELDSKLSNWFTFGSLGTPARKSVSYLLDTSIWDKLYGADKDNRIQWVIGAPTIELFEKAYNEEYSTSYTYTKGTNGYESTMDSIKGNGTFIIQNTPSTNSASGKAYGTWIAANAQYSDSTNVVFASLKNGLYDCLIDGNDVNYGFRPVICLKANT